MAGFEKFTDGVNSKTEMRSSGDLSHWSEPVVVLQPELPWEKETNATLGNPYLEKRDGQYRLYYSASTVKQDDTGFYEPLYLGVAFADSISGPWVRHPEPIMSPSPDNPWRNQGAGSIKLFPETRDGLEIAFNNWIFTDKEGHSRSAIHLISSPRRSTLDTTV